MKRVAAVLAGIVLAMSSGLAAQEPSSVPTAADEFIESLGYQTGTVTLKGGMATIAVPESFRFIDADASRKLLTEGWGNPPAAAARVLGMLVPAEVSPLEKDGWGIVITYDEDGYVDDDDAAGMDFKELLLQMQHDTAEVNEERGKQGFEPVTLVGWAEPPHYDRAAHKLYWAKELKFGESDEHTLNYNIRILGRRGVLVLNAVSSMDLLEPIHAEAESVLAAVEFNEGHRYTDYLPGTDKAAAYGVAGLIAGASAAKAGLFKALWLGLLASKKLLAAGVVAVFAALKRLLSGRTSESPA